MTTELAGQRCTDPLSARFCAWSTPHERMNLEVPSAIGFAPARTSCRMPGNPALLKRAAFLTRNLWVTPYRPDERFPAGEYPNQNSADTGLAKWTKADRNIAETDLVLWYTFGLTHIPRVEDWPVMPVSSISFSLRPDGFFNSNPASIYRLLGSSGTFGTLRNEESS